MLQYTAQDWIAILGALSLFIGAVVAGALSIINALATRIEKVADKVNETLAETKVVVGHVNSEKTAAQGREVTLTKENALLREMLAEKKETAALLAQAVAVGATTAAAIVPAATTAAQSLEHIDRQTAAIETNTQKQAAP